MPVLPANSVRPGTTKLMALAKTVCRFVRLAEPSIRAANAEFPGIIALLDATLAMCALLPAADAEIATMGMTASQFNPPSTDAVPGQLPGV